MVEISTQCSEGSSCYPDRTRLPVVHRCIEHRLGSTLEYIDGVRCMDNNRENTPQQRTRVRSHTQSHALLAAEAYGSDSPGCVRQFHCSTNSQGGTRSIQMCRRTKKLLLMCQANQIVLQARNIPGKLNVLADILSRPSHISGTEWSLHPSVVRTLTRKWGIALLDLFATMWNHKLPPFVSPVPDPSAMAVDAVSMSWKTLWANAYPPPALLPRVLEKAQRDHCELILIAPHWPQAMWFPLLLGILVQPPLRIPNSPRLLSRSDPSRSVQSPATRVGSIRDTLCTVCSRGFSVDVASRVSRLQRESTLAIYESKWRIFTAWCNIQNNNPLSASEIVVSDFLLHLHTEKHLAISTIAGYQMAIASTLPATFGAEV